MPKPFHAAYPPEFRRRMADLAWSGGERPAAWDVSPSPQIAEVACDEHGEFRFRGLSRGSFEIVAAAEGYSLDRESRGVVVEAGAENVILKFRVARWISLAAIDDVDESVVSSAEFEVQMPNTSPWRVGGDTEFVLTGRPDAAGALLAGRVEQAFWLAEDGDPSSAFRFRVYAPGYEPQHVTVVVRVQGVLGRWAYCAPGRGRSAAFVLFAWTDHASSSSWGFRSPSDAPTAAGRALKNEKTHVCGWCGTSLGRPP